MSITTEINRPIHAIVRRAYIKRRLATTGLYETSWFEITDFVRQWGKTNISVDDLRLFRFTHSGLDLVVDNSTGAFNHELDSASLWLGYLTRYRTLVKIEAGYVDDTDAELPTDLSQGVFIMDDEVVVRGNSYDVVLKCKSLQSTLAEVRITEVPSIGATGTASDLVGRIRDHTDGAGTPIFRQFITSTAWTIQATTNQYNFATSTSLENLSCWDFMNKLAEVEGYLLFINRTGGLEFRDRNERTSTSQFTFNGHGFREMNIVNVGEFKEAFNKYFNYFRYKWTEADTLTSYVTAGTNTVVDPSNTSWKFGVRRYEFENTFAPTSTVAQTVVNNLFTLFQTVKKEIKMTSLFVPQLEISDKVTINYNSDSLVAEGLIWDAGNWDDEVWYDSAAISINNANYKIISKQHDLDKMTSNLVLREI